MSIKYQLEKKNFVWILSVADSCDAKIISSGSDSIHHKAQMIHRASPIMHENARIHKNV